ncbi:MAG: sulfatase-like hydrolase/transferase, partial [Bryobacteraceae bacterium]
MTRRDLLALPLAAPLLEAQPRRLNILLIAVDDLNNRLGCYGDPVVKTPHIDRLAARGVRFDRAYCQYPLCNPSRTSLLSGRRPDTTRILDNRTPPRTHLGDVAFLPEHFRKHGYFTGRVGKIAHGAFEDAVAWDVSEFARGRQAAPPRKKAERQRPEGTAAKLAWIATANADADEPDGRTARRIVELMEAKRDRPFFLGAGFHKPHLPWIAPTSRPSPSPA